MRGYPLSAEQRDTIRELSLIYVPYRFIARRVGCSLSTVSAYAAVRAPRVKLDRLARTARIKAHIAEYPGKSICYPESE